MFVSETCGNPHDRHGFETGRVREQLSKVGMVGPFQLVLDEDPRIVADIFAENVCAKWPDRALLSFEPAEGVDPFRLLDALKLVIKSSHLGDNRTLALPVAHTIFWEMGAQQRASMDIAESLIRVSVGIEAPADLLADFEQALASL